MGNFCSKTPIVTENSESKERSDNTAVCKVLRFQTFKEVPGEKLNEKLENIADSDKFGKIQKRLQCLLGNGRNEVLTIPKIVNELFPRNYPELYELQEESKWRGRKKPIKTFVPEWYLTKAPKYIEPKRGPELEKYSEQAASSWPERKKYFEELRKFHIGGQRQHRGELPEKDLYHALQEYYESRDETVAVFHGIDILKLDLNKIPKVNEKDFVIINASYRYIMVIEVKNTLGPGDSIETSVRQLSEAKQDLEAWFGTEGLSHWTYVPVIYTNKIDPIIDSDECNKFIIEGMYIHSIDTYTFVF